MNYKVRLIIELKMDIYITDSYYRIYKKSFVGTLLCFSNLFFFPLIGSCGSPCRERKKRGKGFTQSFSYFYNDSTLLNEKQS